MSILWYVIGGISCFAIIAVILAICYRTVVNTNMVHIVQNRRDTVPYGKGQNAGNVYYRWPSWVPYFGITVIRFPVSNFDLSLKDYEAYDKDRVPFVVDITAFFRINNTESAAQRVANIVELEAQLAQIVQGAVRKVLASDVIDQIMLERAQFGEQFTQEVADQLTEWGVEPVKSMELMDIRDACDSQVIANIMARKTSHIEMESRTEVAENKKKAEVAEIKARQEVDIKCQEAEEVVNKRTAEKEQNVGIAKEKARQEVLTQEKETRERDMEVARVEQVEQAKITKDKEIVAANQDKETKIIIAVGDLEAKEKEAQGIEAIGKAKAEAEKAMQMAPVEAKIALAKEIGENKGYQNYLSIVEAVKAHVVVGGEQAKALQMADVKVISNTGDPVNGVNRVMDLFTSKGGTNIASMVEALGHSPLGNKLLEKFGISENEEKELNN